MDSTLDKVDQFIHALELWSHKDNYNLIFNSFCGSGAFRAVPFPVSEKVSLFRCRVHYNEEIGKDFTRFGDIGYRPDAHNIKVYGRCNNVGQSIAYYSDKEIGACIERISSAKAGEQYEITIGEWQLLEQLNLFCVVEPDKAKRRHDYEKMIGEFYDKEMAKYTDANIVELFNRYFSFLNRRYTSKADGFEYQITAAYANKCFEKMAGMAYASVASKESYNVALKPEIQDKGLVQLKKANKINLVVKKDSPETISDLEIKSVKESASVDVKTKTIVW